MTLKIGIIGCGNISNAYFNACKRFPVIATAACADLDVERAKAKAKEHGVGKACSVDELLNDDEIDIVVNLTIPAAHAEVDLKAIKAGKHVYSEKPFGLTRAEGKKVIDSAKKKKVRVGCAPDTVLGAGTQTCRKLIDDGAIGQPIAFMANMICGGHETWHPSPEFYYQKGGGPMFDMGPYYLHSLISLLGPVKRVTGMTKLSFHERTITSKPKYGKKVKVEIPTHIVGVLEFANGTMGSLTTSFDVKGHHAPCIEIFGTEGTLVVPDPNTFGGPVRLYRPGKEDWAEVPLTHPYTDNGRGLGVADMATAIGAKRKHRANEEIAMHALDIMQAIHEAAKTGKQVKMASKCARPAAMPALSVGLAAGQLDG
jgi:predicted dehydrogenase